MFWKNRVNINNTRHKIKIKKTEEILQLILNTNPDLRWIPKSGEYFVIDRDREICISVTSSLIKVSNHQYLYEIAVPLKFSEKYINMIQNKMQEQGEAIRKELFGNEYELLNKIKELYA